MEIYVKAKQNKKNDAAFYISNRNADLLPVHVCMRINDNCS